MTSSVPAFVFHVDDANTFGQNAPSQVSYIFDKYYFQRSGAFTLFGIDGSDGGFGFSADVVASYDVEFGVKAGLQIKPGTIDVNYPFLVNFGVAPVEQVLDVNPHVSP